ncbi:TrbC/VirB2 family protein [Legionella lytica]|uniref:TrbC/VirB2 family protein n=1 Tax=Legionella lytica TaxID=96232 RepID=A0ABW8DFT0_9GAMM
MSQVKEKKGRVMHTALLSILSSMPTMSHAAISPESIIRAVTHYLTGSLAKAIAILTIVGLGYMCIQQQKFPKEYFVWTLLGLGIVFGGSQLYQVWVK